MNPYAPPKSSTTTVGRGPYVVTIIGLGWYAFFGLVSSPFAVLAREQFDLALRYVSGAERTYNNLAGTFYGFRAIADVGLIVAFIAGLAWLHHSWRRTEKKRSKKRASARAVVAWTLLPIWGFWRVHGFLLELSRMNGLDQDVVKVSRWWGVLAVHMVVRVISPRVFLGWFDVADSCLQAAAVLLGIQMLYRFNRAQRQQVAP